MKNVYANKELCHVWANEKQESARGSNIFFENGIIYSYGKHFPIAKIYTSDRTSSDLVLFTNQGYSSTTAKHKSFVLRAIHQDYLSVPKVLVNDKKEHQENIDYLVYKIKDDIALANHAIKNGNNLLQSAYVGIDNLRLYRDFFNLVLNEDQAQVLKEGFIHPDIINKCRINAEKQKALDIIREQKAIEQEKIDLEAWINGKDKRRNFITTALRIKEGYIETTKGARVTIDSAKVLYLKIKAGEDIKGHIIEGYTVISINGTLKIGCHEIPIEEVERIGKLLI